MSIEDIAHHWSKEVSLTTTRDELLDYLWNAWMDRDLPGNKSAYARFIETLVRASAAYIEPVFIENVSASALPRSFSFKIDGLHENVSYWNLFEIHAALDTIKANWPFIDGSQTTIAKVCCYSDGIRFDDFRKFLLDRGLPKVEFWMQPIEVKCEKQYSESKKDAERRARLSSIKEYILDHWPAGRKRPSEIEMARILREKGKAYGYGDVALQKIIAGRYEPATRLGFEKM